MKREKMPNTKLLDGDGGKSDGRGGAFREKVKVQLEELSER